MNDPFFHVTKGQRKNSSLSPSSATGVSFKKKDPKAIHGNIDKKSSYNRGKKPLINKYSDPPKGTISNKLNDGPRQVSNSKMSSNPLSRDKLASVDPSYSRDHIQSVSEDDEDIGSRKRLKEAKSYLQTLHSHYDAENADANLLDQDIIAARLKKEVLSTQKKMFLPLADSLREIGLPFIKYQKQTNSLTVTALVVSFDNQFIYFCTKDGLLQQYILSTGTKGRKFVIPIKVTKTVITSSKKTKLKKPKKNHIKNSPLYALAISPNGNILVAGGKDKRIHVWNTLDGSYIKALTHHREMITGLVFRHDTSDLTLFSVSSDRSVKVWNMEDMAYTDTLFGHQDLIGSVDGLSKERCITCGSRDRTLRLWKIADESQLVFKVDDVNEGSLDVVVLLDEDHFLSGSDIGTLNIWHTGKKRPVVTLKQAHGEGFGILSSASLKYTDIVASGSNNGFVKIWKVGNQFKSIESLFNIPMDGFINTLSFTWTDDPRNINLVLGTGQDQRLGRWSVNKAVKNSVALVSWHEQGASVKDDESAQSDKGATDQAQLSESSMTDESETAATLDTDDDENDEDLASAEGLSDQESEED